MKKNKGIRKRIFEIIQIGNETDVPSTVFDFFIIAVILTNIAVTFIMTFDGAAGYLRLLKGIEWFTLLACTIEYVLRVWTADLLYPGVSKPRALLKFVFSFTGIVDLLTILPFFLPFFLPSGVAAFRMFRIVRILHLFRINANYDAFNVITDVLKEKKNQLISSVFLIMVLLVASSLCMYDLEHEVQPENFSNAFSGIWWAVSTLLTVGYGDIYPMTAAGRFMAIIIAFLGVGVVAIPTGIVSAGFVEYYTKVKSGTYANKEADFITLEIDKEHPFANKMLKDLSIPAGLYVAVIMKGEDVITPYDDYKVLVGDNILLGTSSNVNMVGKMEEVTLAPKHPWIGMKIKHLDISRQSFVVMVKRTNGNVRPDGETKLKEKDVVLLLSKKQSGHQNF